MEGSISVTVDVEDWYHIPSVTGSSFSVYPTVEDFFEKWKDKYDYLTEPTLRTLKLLDDFNVKATFFIVADVVDHYPGLVEKIIEHGHDIACHGLNHACNVDSDTKKEIYSTEEFKQRTLKAKGILERIAKNEIIGYRAPAAYINGNIMDSLEDMGFRYDSSVYVNSLINKTGIKLEGISTTPYYPKKGSLLPGKKRNFVEFPMTHWNVFGFKFPTSGGPMLRFFGARVIHQGIKQSVKRGHAVFYFHPIDISYEKFPNIGKRRPMYWIIKGKIVERRLKYILKKIKKYRIMTLNEALENYY